MRSSRSRHVESHFKCTPGKHSISVCLLLDDADCFRLLSAGIVTAATIVVDNILQAPFSETVTTDLELLQNLKRSLEQNYDNYMSQPLVSSINELERIANPALRGITGISVRPSALSRASTSQQPHVYQPQPTTSQQWDTGHLSYDNPEEQYVAGPIAYDPAYSVSPIQSLHNQYNPSALAPMYGGPASPSFETPYPITESDPSVGDSLRRQMISAPPDVQHQYRVGSPLQQGFQQRTSAHWRRNSSAEVTQSTLQHGQIRGTVLTSGSESWDTQARPPQPRPPPPRSTQPRQPRSGHKKQSGRVSRGLPP
jgi:hypothetical protein